LLVWLSDRVYLRGKYHVRAVEVAGAEAVRGLVDAGHMVLVAANHADHADPHVMAHIGRAHGLSFHFMAAREVFERQGALGRAALALVGAFSVDREGADLAAVKMAMGILREGRHPLVVFPEGEIFHHHERLAPFSDGAATMLLRASKGQGDGRYAYLVPTAMRYTHDASVSETFSRRLAALEERITWRPREDLDVLERIARLGGGLMAVKEMEFLGDTRSGPLPERLRQLQEELVGPIEGRHFEGRRDGTIPERIKALRNVIRRELTDDLEDAHGRVRELYDELDTLFLAFQLYSYSGEYLSEAPTRDRIAETLLKLEEDVLGEPRYPAPRSATVRFGEPIDVLAFLERGGYDAKTGDGPLTDVLAERIQSMLDAMVKGRASSPPSAPPPLT
jgi:1-acyl-sn-glycerol-3-phosphate acyltransferase